MRLKIGVVSPEVWYESSGMSETAKPAGMLLEDCVRQREMNLMQSHPYHTVLGFCFRGTTCLTTENGLAANEDLCNMDCEGIWT